MPLGIGIEDPRLMPVQRPHDADPGMHEDHQSNGSVGLDTGKQVARRKFPQVHFRTFSVERNRRSRVTYLGQVTARGCAVRGRQIKFQLENPVIGGIFLGVTVSGASALVAMGVVVLAFM
jgi:hypothetical protein